jgi:hypothetical protein
MGQVGAVASVVQAGASLFGGGGGGGTQYVPNYSAMNEVQLASIDLLSRNYDMQSQLNDAAFQNNMGLQDAEYKRLITQMVYDQANQHQSLLSQAYQAQAATNVAETSLDLQRLQQVYERGARDVAAKAEYTNLMDRVQNERSVRELMNAGSKEEFQRKLAETQAQMSDSRQMRDMEQSGERLQRDLLGAEYAGLSIQERQALMEELLQQERLTSQMTELSKQRSGADTQEAGIKTQASQQREQVMSQFLEQARQQELENANQLTRMGASGLVDPSANIARQQMGQAINPIDQMKRELGLNQANTGEALGLAGVQNTRGYLEQLEQAALRGDVLAQQQLQIARDQIGVQRGQLDTRGGQMDIAQQQSQLQFGANQRGLQNQYGSLMNSMYMDAIQNGLAPELAAQLAQRQAHQALNLQQGSANVQGLLDDYGYDIGKSGIGYSRAQDNQALVDYQRMIDSQGQLNLSAAEAQYMTGLQSAYAQQAGMQSQLASGASAGINNAASNIRGSVMVDQPGSQGFNWGGLGQLGQAGVSLFGAYGGFNRPTQQTATPQQNIGYTQYNPFPYMGHK